MRTTSLFIYTETPLHAGVGSTVSVVDLPIQRERTTQFPIVQGSGIKGALRSQLLTDNTELLFGSDPSRRKDTFPGAVSVGDARIVLFPVRSLAGVFAYVTCPAVLARLTRDVQGFPALTGSVGSEEAWVTGSSEVTASNRVVLEEFSFAAKAQPAADKVAAWLAENALPSADAYTYWRTKVQRSLVILHDDAFRDFVQNSTEIVTHVHLDSAKKTVMEGQLWTQEQLPADSLLVSSIMMRASRDERQESEAAVAGKFQQALQERIQIGGDETTGQGMVALRWHGGN